MLFSKASPQAVLLFLVGIILHTLHPPELAEAVDLAALDRSEDAIAQSLVLTFKGGEELFHFLTLGVSVGGAEGFDYRQVCL